MALVIPPTKNILPGPRVTIVFTKYDQRGPVNMVFFHGNTLHKRGYYVSGFIGTGNNPVLGCGRLLGHIRLFNPHTIAFTEHFAGGRLYKHLCTFACEYEIKLYRYKLYIWKHLGETTTL